MLLMILGAGSDQIDIIKKAKEMGLETVVIDKNPDAIGFQYADHKEVFSIKDKYNVLTVATDMNVDGVIAPCSDAGLLSAGIVNSSMNLKGPNAGSVVCAMYKKVAKSLFYRNGINVPRDFDELSEYYFPSIVKPVDGVGSRGVYKLESFWQKPHPSELVKRAKSYSQVNEVIIEEYLPGTVFNVDLLLQNGKVIYGTLHDELFDEGKNNFGVDIFVHPSEYVNKGMQIPIVKKCIKAVKALQITDGNVAVEGVVHNDKIYIFEVNPRMSGSFHMQAHTLSSYKRDWIEDGIKVALGIPVDPLPLIMGHRILPQTAHAWAMIGSEKAGTIKHITGPEEGVLTWHLKYVGDTVEEFNGIETSTDQSVVVIYTNGDSREDAVDKINYYRKQVKIEVE